MRAVAFAKKEGRNLWGFLKRAWRTALTKANVPYFAIYTLRHVFCTRLGWVASASVAKRINFSTVFAGQAVGIKEVQDDIWLVSFMDYDLGYFDLETRVLEPLENPFGPKVLPM